DCPLCKQPMFVTRSAVIHNWQYNALMWPFFGLWGIIAGLVILNPEKTSDLTKLLEVPDYGFPTRVCAAILSFLPAFICAIPFAVIGRLIGHVVAGQLQCETDSDNALLARPSVNQELESERWMRNQSNSAS